MFDLRYVFEFAMHFDKDPPQFIPPYRHDVALAKKISIFTLSQFKLVGSKLQQRLISRSHQDKNCG